MPLTRHPFRSVSYTSIHGVRFPMTDGKLAVWGEVSDHALGQSLPRQ